MGSCACVCTVGKSRRHRSQCCSGDSRSGIMAALVPTADNSSRWVVLKFGGTSVATAGKWKEIIGQAKRVLAEGHKCWLVVSAVTTVTNFLIRAMADALESTENTGNYEEFESSSFTEIVKLHRQLWSSLEFSFDDEAFTTLSKLFADLKRLLFGIALCGEASPRMRAKVTSFGELMSSFIGLHILSRAGLGVPTKRVDARKCLIARSGAVINPEDVYLSACVDPSYDPDIIRRVVGEEIGCVITQGFIGSTLEGDTCLLGRGGSDTSAALFSALIGAARCEIWTDVHGLFTSDPRHVKGTRLIKGTTYRVAQELASMGAKVLHPRCIVPAAWGKIPIEIHNTEDPNGPCTAITAPPVTKGLAGTASPRVLAVTCRNGQGLVHIDSVDMWGESGFLAKVFQPFREMDVSVDLVATSQYAVSLTLDHIPGGFEGSAFTRVISLLKRMGSVRTRYPCSVVSIVGEHLRSALPEIGSALRALENHGVHLMTQSCEDLNMSFVVDEDVAKEMVANLHEQFFRASQGGEGDDVMGQTWEQLKNEPPTPPSLRALSQQSTPRVASSLSPVQRSRADNEFLEPMVPLSLSTPQRGTLRSKWWMSSVVREALLALGADGSGHYVYNEATVVRRCDRLICHLKETNVVDKLYYAMKANSNPRVLELISNSGFGMECVSIDEVRFVRTHLGNDCPILFSPNFCPMKEFSEAFRLGAQVIVDDITILRQDPTIFKGRRIAFRVDPVAAEESEVQHGHHKHVRTSGAGQKFGLPLTDVPAALREAKLLGATVVGIHSHVGSGVLEPTVWRDTAETLKGLSVDPATGLRRPEFADVEWFDLGGGLGVAGQNPDAVEGVDLAAVANALEGVASSLNAMTPPIKLHMEPGRYLVSESGVLVTSVTQIRKKRSNTFVGTATGMNSLLRPALYSAWHDIVNLSLAVEGHNNQKTVSDPNDYYNPEMKTMICHIVGPICETADVLGHSRTLPAETCPGNVLLIANAGAYGYTMGSNYNMRSVVSEVTI